MKIVCLMENTNGNVPCICEHGLSLYIETGSHRIISDFGQSLDMLKNAETLGIDLSKIDMMFLSHGHYDHSGALCALARKNPHAAVYMQRGALSPRRHGERSIGISEEAASLPSVVLLDGDYAADDNLSVFSRIGGNHPMPPSNSGLEQLVCGEWVRDDFLHEQCLVVSEGNMRVLISGCAHSGILNILDRFRSIYGGEPDAVVTGFHMKKNSPHTAEEIEFIRETAHTLAALDTVFYTGHCTGVPAFEIMKEIMGDKLVYMHSGDTVIL